MHAPYAFKLNPCELAQWQDMGYFMRADQFTASELDQLRDAAERAVLRAGRMASQGQTYFLDGRRFVDVDSATIQYEYAPDAIGVKVLEPVQLFDQQLDQLIDDPRLKDPMVELVGTDTLALWTAKLNMKPSGGSGFGWHQDSPYWIHDCDHVDRLPNVMLTLDRQDQYNGCFRVIRGSHQQGMLPGTRDDTQLGGFYTDPTYFDVQHEDVLQAAAGTLIFFNPHIVHGSADNHSDTPRRALIFTYQPGGFPMLKNRQIRNVPVGGELGTT